MRVKILTSHSYIYLITLKWGRLHLFVKTIYIYICFELGMGIIAYSALGLGFFPAGKWL